MRGNLIGRHVPEGYMTTSTFADRMGVSKTTVYKWVREGSVVPKRMKFGKLSVAIFGQADVERIQEDWKEKT